MSSNRIALVSFENEIAWGLRSIAQFLRSKGFNVSLYFLERYANVPRGVPIETTDSFVRDFAPIRGDVVGISFMTPYLSVAQQVAEKVRACGACVVVGGIHPTILPQECKPFSDYVIRGAGEQALLDLLTALSEETPPPRGVFKEEEWFWFSEDVSIFPHPRYGEVADTIIVQGRVEKTTQVPRRIGLITRYQTFCSYGCVYGCTYCVNPVLQDLSGRRGKRFLRRRNIDEVIAELNHVKSRVDAVAFEDEDFLVDGERVSAFLKRYAQEVGLAFSCLVTPSTLRPEKLLPLAQQLKDARCTSITIGLQSASPRTAKIFRRPFNRDWLQQIARAFARVGILVTYDVILDNPFEDESDVRQTVDAVLSLPYPLEVNVFYLTFFPGYVLTEMARQQGITIQSGGNTRTSRKGTSVEEVVIRLAQIPFVPRRLLRTLYSRKSVGWSRGLLNLMGQGFLPLWTSKWATVARIAWMNPALVWVSLKRLPSHLRTRFTVGV